MKFNFGLQQMNTSLCLPQHFGIPCQYNPITLSPFRIRVNRWHQSDSCCVTNKQKQPAEIFPWPGSSELGQEMEYGLEQGGYTLDDRRKQYVTDLEVSMDELPEEDWAEKGSFSLCPVRLLWTLEEKQQALTPLKMNF